MVLEKRQPICYRQIIKNAKTGEVRERLTTASPIYNREGTEIELVIYTDYDIAEFERRLETAMKAPLKIDALQKARGGGTFVYASRAMEELIKETMELANLDVSVLIFGETGTGKELFAQLLHTQSSRKEKEFVVVNCAALPENLLDAELFGYEKGSFTGALEEGKRGMVEMATGGTLFLDEINSLPLNLQAKLLRILETKKVRRIGSHKEIPIDFRLISATNVNLEDEVKANRFRTDLYYRLNVVPLQIPPLRERREDIEPLCTYFLEKFNKKYNKHKTLAEKAKRQLLAYDWPGNVRELKNYMERIVITGVYSDIVGHLSDLDNGSHAENYDSTPKARQDDWLENEESRRIIETICESGYNLTIAAENLHMARRTLYNKMEKYGIEICSQIVINGETYQK